MFQSLHTSKEKGINQLSGKVACLHSILPFSPENATFAQKHQHNRQRGNSP